MNIMFVWLSIYTNILVEYGCTIHLNLIFNLFFVGDVSFKKNLSCHICLNAVELQLLRLNER